jgi:hypothetical protein
MTNPWAHGRINNESSYDLILVDKTLAGTDQYRWNKEPPVKIPAKTQMNDIYDAMSNTLLWGYVSCGAVYEASVDGFVVRITFGITANDHPAGGSSASWKASKDKILNVYQKPPDPKGSEITVTFTIREWPD